MIESILPSQDLYRQRSLKIVYSAVVNLGAEPNEKLSQAFQRAPDGLIKSDSSHLQAVMFRAAYRLIITDGRDMNLPQNRLEQLYRVFGTLMRDYGGRDWRDAALGELTVMAKRPLGFRREAAVFGNPNQAARFGQVALQAHYQDIRRHYFISLLDDQLGDTEEILPTRGFIPFRLKADHKQPISAAGFLRETDRMLYDMESVVEKLGRISLGNQIEFVKSPAAEEYVSIQPALPLRTGHSGR